MASSFTFQVKGLDNVLKRLQQFPKEVQENALSAIESNVQVISREQKRRAPVGVSGGGGGLRGLTSFDLVNGSYILFSNARYAPFIEFGTRGKFRLQYSETAAYASQFKGKGGGGSYEEFIRLLTAWVRKKGLAGRYSVKTKRRLGSKAQRQSEDEKLARFLAFYITKNGIRPQPFFFAPFFERRPQILKDVKAAINAK